MAADVKQIDTWSAYCNQCRWSAIFFSEESADREADVHDDEFHAEEDE